MIGVPGSGKSTECKNLLDEFPGIAIVSTDQYIEELAHKIGKTYNEVYREAEPIAQKLMKAQLSHLFKNNERFIWDQTNISVKSRKKKLARLKQEKYEVIAIAIELSYEELTKRVNKRIANGGKSISWKITKEMMDNYQSPTYAEGFSEIFLIKDDAVKILLNKTTTTTNKI